MKRPTVKQLEEEVRHIMGIKNVPDYPYFQDDVVLLASAVVGPSQRKLRAFTNYPMALIKSVAQRARATGIWKGNKVNCEWFEEGHGGVAFICDSLVLAGLLKRTIASEVSRT
jgi:hypothetical protein